MNEKENTDLKEKLKEQEEKIRKMTDNYAECQAENSEALQKVLGHHL